MKRSSRKGNDFPLSLLVYFVLFSFVLYYLKRMETCACAATERRRLLYYFVGFNLVLVALIMLLHSLRVNPDMIYMISAPISIIIIVLSYFYSAGLRNVVCVCSEHWTREFMYYYSIISMILWAVIALFLLMGIIGLILLMKGAK